MSDDQHSPPVRSRRIRPKLLAGAAAVVVIGAAAGTAVALLDRRTPPHYTTLPRSRAIAAAPSPTGAPSAPVAVSSPQYTQPRDTCKLVTATTLATYLPGATVVPGLDHHPSGPNAVSACGWNSGASSSSGAGLTLSMNLTDPNLGVNAQPVYQSDVQYATKSTTNGETKTTPEGTQQVNGVGDQATAVFETQTDPVLGTSQLCQLILWSGNAAVQVTFIYSTNPQLTTSPPPKRPAQVAAATAVARDVLAALPKS